MKKLLIFLSICLFAIPAFALGPQGMMTGQSVIYSGTITGLRISSVDGTAFIDNCSAITGYAGSTHKVVIFDASGNTLKGYLKDVGSSETLGSELISTWTNSSLNPWETFNPSAPNLAAVNTSGNGRSDFGTLTNYKLTKTTINCTYNSGTPVGFGIGETPGVFFVNIGVNMVSGANTFYRTLYPHYNVLGVYTYTSVDVSLTCSSKYVTAPSSSGITIVNSPGGTTYNWAVVSSSFGYNAASYSVRIYR